MEGRVERLLSKSLIFGPLVLLVAVAYLLSNLVVDVLYAWLDPRIRYG